VIFRSLCTFILPAPFVTVLPKSTLKFSGGLFVSCFHPSFSSFLLQAAFISYPFFRIPFICSFSRQSSPLSPSYHHSSETCHSRTVINNPCYVLRYCNVFHELRSHFNRAQASTEVRNWAPHVQRLFLQLYFTRKVTPMVTIWPCVCF
jgi:hypothetical protein